MASTTEIRTQITKDYVEKLQNMLRKELDDDIFNTGENLNTLTFCCGEVEGKEVFGSIKFTLHKANYNLDDEIEKYESFREEKELNAKLRAEKKAADKKKREEKQAKAAEKEAQKQKEKEKRQASIVQMREQITSV